jgi:hypothetical protein
VGQDPVYLVRIPPVWKLVLAHYSPGLQ